MAHANFIKDFSSVHKLRALKYLECDDKALFGPNAPFFNRCTRQDRSEVFTADDEDDLRSPAVTRYMYGQMGMRIPDSKVLNWYV